TPNGVAHGCVTIPSPTLIRPLRLAGTTARVRPPVVRLVLWTRSPAANPVPATTSGEAVTTRIVGWLAAVSEVQARAAAHAAIEGAKTSLTVQAYEVAVTKL